MSKLLKPNINDLEKDFYEKAVTIISKSRERIINQIYKETTTTYFKLGELIVEKDQKGNESPEYGKSTLSNLSRKLTAKFGKGFSISTLKDARQFYNTYKNRQNDKENLDFSLGYSSYILLMRTHENEREFYEKIAIREKMDYPRLKIAISSNLALRALQNPQDLKDLRENNIPTRPSEVIKDPYIADYLGLKDIKEGDETKLEQAIINNLEKFLMELGRGFAFVGRQYKFNLSGSVFKADLVFYNIILKRYVIFELKVRAAQHKDIGQLQMYVNYFDRDICLDTDNNTIGVLLCT
jgi:predicted nuclease of restriction endonuclease-like (RecB) superfamily